ncbi:MAG: zinc-ribbon domain-containing protein [Lachnospiraceae bacterium]|nr:zinc-ribbon domain-containing protein [Lachnospiraceae bacterium]
MYCENCGKYIPDGALFCGECGSPVEGAASAPVQPAYQPMQQGKDDLSDETGNKPLPVASSGKMPAIICAALAVVAVIAMILILREKTGIGKSGNDDPDGNPVVSASLGSSVSPSDGTGSSEKSGNGESEKSANTGSTADPERPDSDVDTGDTSKPDDNENGGITPESDDGQNNTEKQQSDRNPAIGSYTDYDTGADPAWEDFGWFLDEDMEAAALDGEDMFLGDGVEKLTEYEDIIGGWKGYLCYDPKGTSHDIWQNGTMVYLTRFEISGTEDAPIFYLDWVRSRNTFNGEEEEIRDREAVLECTRKDGVIEGTDDGGGWRIRIEHFGWAAGQEYAYGSMKDRDGADYAIALFRP